MPEKKEATNLKNPFSENFTPRWERWKAFKKEQFRFTYKPIGEQGALDKLYRLSSGDEGIAHQIIEEAIANGWKGFFELKQTFNGAAHQRKSSEVGKTIEFDRP